MTYCVSDIHGDYELFSKLKNLLKDNDICYILGDLPDRGPDGWKIIKEVFSDKRFIYIKGNHEEMLVNTMEEYLRYYADKSYNDFTSSYMYKIISRNGGEQTIHDWSKEPNRQEWIDKLKSLPEELIYNNNRKWICHLSHAGFTPGYAKNLLWDGGHFYDGWPNGYDNMIVIHGHTAISGTSLASSPIKFYADGHKINIDSECYNTHVLGVLDLDTFDQIILTKDEEIQCE